jgi:hypothetical protein
VQLASDALPLFAGAQWLLASDPTLWCIAGGDSFARNSSNVTSSSSSSNNSSTDAHALQRTDAPPLIGNGWLVSANTASEVLKHYRKRVDTGSSVGLRSWLATPDVRKGRQCVFPRQPRVWASLDAAGADEEFTHASANVTVNELLKHANNNAKRDDDGELIKGESQPPPFSWFEADLSYLLEPAYGLAVFKVNLYLGCLFVGGRSVCAESNRVLTSIQSCLTSPFQLSTSSPAPATSCACDAVYRSSSPCHSSATTR